MVSKVKCQVYISEYQHSDRSLHASSNMSSQQEGHIPLELETKGCQKGAKDKTLDSSHGSVIKYHQGLERGLRLNLASG